MSWRLLFSAAGSIGWLVYVGGVIIFAILLSVWLLRLERRMVSRSVGWTLLGLRSAILLLLLATMLKPLLTKQFDVDERGRVIVAVDVSVSMETQDRHASLAEKLRWAQALGMLGNQDTAPLLERWIAKADAGREPDWLGKDSPPQNPVEQSAFDSRRLQVMEALDELASMPRIEFVRRLLTAPPGKLLSGIENVMPVDLRLFATQQQPITAQELESRLKSPRSDLIPGGTDAVQTIRTLMAEDDARSIRSVILLTDGRQTVPADASAEAQKMAALNVPVYCIPVGSQLIPRDLSIAAVEAPEAIFLNDKALIRVVLGTAGFEGQDVTVELESDGQVLQQQVVTPVSDTTPLSFAIPTEKTGRFDFRILSPTQPGELRDDNNSRVVSLQVIDSKARVMLVEGDARWEFRYLKNLLERDKQVQLTSVLFRQPWLEILNQPGITSTLPALDAFRELLATTDVLILGDVTPQEVDADVWQLLDEAITRDGLTLLVLPGKRGMPVAFQSEILSGLLPVSEFRQRIAEQFQPTPEDAEQTAFHLSLSQEAQSLPMFQLSENPVNRDTSLASLPGHPWIYAGTPRPGATVWATAAIPGATTNPEPVIVQHGYGFGQVIWLGLDSTWRWRRRAGDEWHYRFWGQLIRWGARNKAAAGNSDVRIAVSDVIIDEGEAPEATLTWNKRLVDQLAGATIELIAEKIGRDGQADTQNSVDQSSEAAAANTSDAPGVLKSILVPSPASPERFTGRVPQLTEGTWRISARTINSQIDIPDIVQTEMVVRRQLSAELANVSCNREFLKQISDLSGGEMIEPWEATHLISLLQPEDQAQQKILEKPLWDHWLILLLFCTLLSSEWVLRRLHGLP